MNCFYTYVLAYPDETPFYVGKGQKKRYISCGGNLHAQNIHKQITKGGQKVLLYLIPAESEEAAFAEEKRLISLYGRQDLGTGSLCNYTDGGEGPSGYHHTPSTIAKLKIASTGNQHAKGSKGRIGTRHTQKTKDLISKLAKKRPNMWVGRHHTTEAKARMRQAKVGLRLSPATEFKTPIDSFDLDHLPKPDESTPQKMVTYERDAGYLSDA